MKKIIGWCVAFVATSCLSIGTNNADEPAAEADGIAKPVAPITDPAALLFQKLSSKNQQAVADMLTDDWKNRPEWVEMAIAVLRDEAMQPGGGWWRAADKKFGWTWLKRKCDANGDGLIDLDELPSEADVIGREKLFARLDVNADEQLTSADFEHGMMSGRNEMNFAAMKGRMADVLFQQLDTDTNGQVTQEEMLAFFRRADREDGKFLTAEDLLAVLGGNARRASDSATTGPSVAEQIKRFFNGEFGWFETGPNVGDIAPDFTLPKHDQSGTIALGDSQKRQKPVVLILGSFT